ncbi:hypothetical protein N7504_006321 [Penicillium tannophilum]|nr:hypothetical protein N7504_006321 [Penicillium tannophilum]
MYQASDQSLYTTSTSTSATSTSSSSTASSATSSAASSNTLSGGAKAGIAIGSVVGALLLLGVGLFFWRSYRKKRRLEEGGTQGAMQAHELDYNMAMRPVPIPIELENRSVGSQFGGKPVLGHTRTPELE